MQFLPRKDLLSLEEIARIAKIFADNGVTKFRFTGGEPLIRKNLQWLIKEVSRYQGVSQIGITTNGSQLKRFAFDLKKAGVTKLNISLDTLNPKDFLAITKVGKLSSILDGITMARSLGMSDIRLNTVIMKGKNDDQIIPLVEYARENQLNIAFIEEMPLGKITYNRQKTYISSEEIRLIIAKKYPLYQAAFKKDDKSGPASYWVFKDGCFSKIGFISPHSCNFCADCNRLRLTVEGRLLLCLGYNNSIDLRAMLRLGKSDSEIADAIYKALQKKPKEHEFKISEKVIVPRYMNYTGG